MSEEIIRESFAGAKELDPAERIRVEVARLVKLDRAAYLAERKAVAKLLSIPTGELDKLVAEAQKKVTHRTDSNIRTGSVQPLGAEGLGDCSNGCSNTSPVRTVDELRADAQPIIETSDVLAMVQKAIESSGYAGDPNPVLLVYTAASSRLLEKPINAQVIGPSASGKSFCIDAALRMIPDEATIKMTASSPKAIIHSYDDLRHKMIVLKEIDSIVGLEGNAASLIRSIIEDCRTDFDVVEKDESGHFVTKRITKEGPTGLITSGVRELEFQTATRVLNIVISDSPEQTREILIAEGEMAAGKATVPDPKIIGQFLAFQL